MQIDTRNRYFTAINFEKYEPEGGFEANKDYTLKIDLDRLGGADQVGTYPITLKELKFTPNKSAPTGEQTLKLKAFYAHYSHVAEGITGDVNSDGRINVSDVATLINMILGLETMNQSRADVNGDGRVNVSDVSALINIILS